MGQHLGLIEWVKSKKYHQLTIQHWLTYLHSLEYKYKPRSTTIQELLAMGTFYPCLSILHGQVCQVQWLTQDRTSSEMGWCCKENNKTIPLRSATKEGDPYLHVFKCLNCKGNHLVDNYHCLYWRNCFNRNWHGKKSREALQEENNIF